MKYTLALLAALFSQSEAATAKLVTQSSSRKTIKSVSSKPATGAFYELEVPLKDGVDYITTTLTSYDMVCDWHYKLNPEASPVRIAKNLEFCDFPTRSMSSKTISMTMPIAGVPEFDMEGASLLISCQMGTTRLSKVSPDCAKKATDHDAHKDSSYFTFYEASSSAPAGLIQYIVWG